MARPNTKPDITDNDKDGGGDVAEQFEDLIQDLVDADEWEVLDIIEAALGAAIAKTDLPDLGNALPDAVNDDFWGGLAGPDKSTKEQLEYIQDRFTNDPEFDKSKWSQLIKTFGVGASGVNFIFSAYAYYTVWVDINWIADNTKGWTAEEYISVFADLVKDVPFVIITMFAEMMHLMGVLESGGSFDEVVFDDNVERWNPPPVPVRTSDGTVTVTQPKPDKLEWTWERPAEFNPPADDWVDDLKTGLREELRDWFTKREEHGEQPDVEVDPFAPPGIAIEIPTTVSARDKWKQGRLPINLTQWQPDPFAPGSPAEKWRLRKDRKMSGYWLYTGFLKLLNKTYGELDEIREVWEAIEDNLTLEYSDGRIEHWNELSASEKILALNSLGKGLRLNIDGDGLIFDLFMNELIDRTVGTMSKAEREWLREQGIGGIFDAGNMSTWWKRWERTQKAIEEQQREKQERENQSSQGVNDGL